MVKLACNFRNYLNIFVVKIKKPVLSHRDKEQAYFLTTTDLFL